jgi:hypothetical protein
MIKPGLSSLLYRCKAFFSETNRPCEPLSVFINRRVRRFLKPSACLLLPLATDRVDSDWDIKPQEEFSAGACTKLFF